MKLNQSSFFIIFLFSFLLFNSFSSVTAQSSNVFIVEITDVIDQSTVETISESIYEAKRQDSQAIILLIDTPGGGLAQTFEIANMIHNSSIPFVGFVYPTGATAWSAGTFILISTHIAAMADFTVIGSCQPVFQNAIVTLLRTLHLLSQMQYLKLLVWFHP